MIFKRHLIAPVLLYVLMLFESCTVYKPGDLSADVTQDVLANKGNDTVVVQAGKNYKAGKFKRFLFGDHYRDVWTAPVKVSVIDLKEEKGGLEILERGGGMQTYSLKVVGGDGKRYSLRSIQKDPTQALPLPLQFSFARDVLQDQISAAHPYGAFILPPFGDAAGIYHTNPKLVYVPDTHQLMEYQEDFGGMLAMLEEDARGDWSGHPSFGNTKNAISTNAMFLQIKADNDNFVDQKNLLKGRLFDMWIGDWDRHDGQYRWGEFSWKEGGEKGKHYRPIPKDRDNAFSRFDGLIPYLFTRSWGFRLFQNFDTEVKDMIGLNFNARHLDRRFLTHLEKDEWLKIAMDLQERFTDDVIENAVGLLPDTVYAISGQELIDKLKIRRGKLRQFAERYYEILAREVDIVGSDKREYFEAIRNPDGTIEVNVYEATKEGQKRERRFYHRIFHVGETDEIRLYGLGGEDFFYVSGHSKKSPLIRIIGGEGEDTFADSSRVSGLSRKTIFYDDEQDNILTPGKETKLQIVDDANINHYNYKSFEYDYLGPAVDFGLNSDDGIFFGGGVNIITHGFRKAPYATYQRILTSYAPKTSAWDFEYIGDFTQVLGDLGINIGLSVRAPNFFTNFYGFGNETKRVITEDSYFYRLRYEEVLFSPGLRMPLGDQASIKFGPAYQYARIRQETGKFIDITAPSFDNDIFDASHFAGFELNADVRTTQNIYNPQKGIKWMTTVKWLAELNNDNSKLSQLESGICAYYTIEGEGPFKITFAARLGGSSISGDFNIYQASTIGGNRGLSRPGTVRGYSRDRFSGRSSMYQNNEVRISLLKIPFYYLPFEIGILGHFDQGRVWIEDEDSDQWHTGVGGGIWLSPLGQWVFTATYTKGEDESIFGINLGFLF